MGQICRVNFQQYLKNHKTTVLMLSRLFVFNSSWIGNACESYFFQFEISGGPFDTWGICILMIILFSTLSLNVQFFFRPYQKQTIFFRPYQKQTIFFRPYQKQTIFFRPYQKQTIFFRPYQKQTIFFRPYQKQTIFSSAFEHKTVFSPVISSEFSSHHFKLTF